MEAERREVASRVTELQRFVAAQERLLLERLAKLDQAIVRRQEESIGRLLREVSSIGEQIRELEERSQQPPGELLQVLQWGSVSSYCLLRWGWLRAHPKRCPGAFLRGGGTRGLGSV